MGPGSNQPIFSIYIEKKRAHNFRQFEVSEWRDGGGGGGGGGDKEDNHLRSRDLGLRTEADQTNNATTTFLLFSSLN